MFSFFRNGNDEQRRDDNPRFIFIQRSRNSRPLLTEQGYMIFSGSFFFIWLLFVFVLWIFRIEIYPSKDFISSIAGSSVELSALALAVLGIIHELNKADKWFKLGLLLVALLFIGVVLAGFLLALTWRTEYDQPQQIEVYVFAALGIVTVTQIDWAGVVRISRINILKKIPVPKSLKLSIDRIRVAIPFLLPILIIWTPDLNRLTGVILLFSGGVVALATLMVVTTVSLLVTKPTEETEDEFVAVLKARYETEIKTIIRFGELKSLMLATIRFLQNEHIRNQGPNTPVLKGVERKHIFDHLRELGNSENERSLETVLSSLIEEGKVSQESYSGPYWLVPDHAEMEIYVKGLDSLAVTYSVDHSSNPKDKNSTYLFGTYSFDALRDWLAIKSQLPNFIAEEYVMPKILRELADSQHFVQIQRIDRGYGSTYSSSYTTWLIFVNKKWEPHSIDLAYLWQESKAVLNQIIEIDRKINLLDDELHNTRDGATRISISEKIKPLRWEKNSCQERIVELLVELPTTDGVTRAITPSEVSQILSILVEQE